MCCEYIPIGWRTPPLCREAQALSQEGEDFRWGMPRRERVDITCRWRLRQHPRPVHTPMVLRLLRPFRPCGSPSRVKGALSHGEGMRGRYGKDVSLARPQHLRSAARLGDFG